MFLSSRYAIIVSQGCVGVSGWSPTHEYHAVPAPALFVRPALSPSPRSLFVSLRVALAIRIDGVDLCNRCYPKRDALSGVTLCLVVNNS